MTCTRLLRFAVAAPVFALALLAASPAAAQNFGARVGASFEPDQFYFGGHVETRPLADRVHFRPNAEIGIGSDVTVMAFNFELAYHFESSRPWALYAGGGPALIVFDRENSGSDAEGGFNIVLGVEHRDGLFFEIKGGAIDSPNFKIGVGYNFKRR